MLIFFKQLPVSIDKTYNLLTVTIGDWKKKSIIRFWDQLLIKGVTLIKWHSYKVMTQIVKKGRNKTLKINKKNSLPSICTCDDAWINISTTRMNNIYTILLETLNGIVLWTIRPSLYKIHDLSSTFIQYVTFDIKISTLDTSCPIISLRIQKKRFCQLSSKE